MSKSREIGGATAGLGTSTARLSITNVAAQLGILPPSYDLPPLTNSNSGFQEQFLTLANGDSTIAIPSNAVGVFLLPPANNAVAWTLKMHAGDTGQPMNLLGWAFICPTASFVLNVPIGTLIGFVLIWV